VYALGIRRLAKRTVEPGNETAERMGFRLAHVGKIDEVAAGDDLRRARGRGLRLAMLDEVVLIGCDPAADRLRVTWRLEPAIGAARVSPACDDAAIGADCYSAQTHSVAMVA
jgi:hypothetical protein